MGVRRTASLGAALISLAVLAPSAGARARAHAPPAPPPDEPVQTTGSIVYAWHGDPARGCAQAGLCGVHGALVIQPQGGADVSALGPGGTTIMFFGESATVRVQGGALGAGGECVDQVEGDPSFMSLSVGRNDTLAGTFAGSVSSGHCAGPVSQDLARLLIRGRRSRRRHPSYDLRGSLPFTAGPFSGTLTSTLVLRPSPPSANGGGFSSSESGSALSSPNALVEEVDLRYRVLAAPSALGFTFAGESGPFCTAMNSCGGRGSLSLGFPRLQSEVEIAAVRPVKRRVGRAQALRDLLAGRLTLIGAPPVNWVAPRLSESFTDGSMCSDSVNASQVALGFGSFSAPSASVLSVTVSTFPPFDPLRTHCPGPEATDVLGGSAGGVTLAGARIPRRRLLRRSWSFTLDAHGSFAAAGYTGARSGRLAVTMALLKVTAGTHKAGS